MTFTFNPAHGVIRVNAEIEGPLRTASLILTLDTGATRTTIDETALIGVGYNPAQASLQLPVTMGSASLQVPLLTVSRLQALGQDRSNLPVFAHQFPSTASSDGVLGLDFFAGMVLTLDFRQGTITLS